MIILKQLKIAGFGSSSDVEVTFDPRRISLFVGDNEVGKSTLAKALFAALYGLEYHKGKQRTTPLEHADLWRPAGGDFGVELIVQRDDRDLQITWDFADKRLTVRDVATLADLTDEFRIGSGKYNLGQELLGVGPAEFAKVCFVAQGHVSAPNSVQGLADLAQRFAGSEQGDSTAADAIAALEAPLKRYAPAIRGGAVQLETEIKRLREERATIAGRRSEIESEREQLAPAEECFQDLVRAEEELKCEAALARIQEKVARLREARKDLTDAETAGKRLNDLRKQHEEQSGLEAMDHFAKATDEDEDKAASLRTLSSDATRKLAGIRNEVATEEESLRSDNVDLARLNKLRGQFKSLSNDERAHISDSEPEALKLDQEITSARSDGDSARNILEEITRRRTKARKVADVTLLLGILAVITGGVFGFMMHPALFALAAAGMAGIVIGWILRTRSRDLRATDYLAAKTAFPEQDERARFAERSRKKLDASLRELIERTDAENVDVLRADVRDLNRLELRCRALEDLRDDVDKQQRALDEVAQELATLAERFEFDLDSEQTTAQQAEALLEGIRAARKRQEQLKRVQADISRAERRRDEAGAPDDLAANVESLQQDVNNACGAQGLDEPPAAPETAAFYSDRTARINEDIGATGREREAAARQVMEIHKRVREELPELDKRGERLDTALARAERHQAALDLALDEMGAVAQLVHSNWASQLNEQANIILGAMTPTLETLRFDENLNFHVKRAGNGDVLGQKDADHQLSSGQRDQLYLAIRLGIAAFAGGGGPLPLILDDPFVNFDDDRFRAAAIFLAEHISPTQQVILFTCHRRRFEWLRREAPNLFEQRFDWEEIDALSGKFQAP